MRWNTSLLAIPLLSVAGTLGCLGDVGGPVGDPAGPGGPGATDRGAGTPTGRRDDPNGMMGNAPRAGTNTTPVGTTVAPPLGTGTPAAEVVSRAPLRRLARQQWVNAVRDLFGVTSVPISAFSVDEGDFGANATVALKDLQVEQYRDAAENVARAAVTNLKTLAPCASMGGAESACAEQTIRQLGRRVYRRPLDATEVAAYQQLFTVGRMDADFASGLRVVIAGMLQAPAFLYRFELGTGAPDPMTGLLPLDAHEVATRLSFLLWNTTPDDTLLAAADANQLRTPEAIATQARRLLADPRARDGLANFHALWLDTDALDSVDKDAKMFPSFDQGVRAAMREELTRFVDGVYHGDGALTTLLTSTSSFLSRPLYALYGVTAPAGATATTWKQEALPPEQRRAGVLTTLGVLTTHAHADQTSIVQRGLLVRSKLLCTIPPSPPPDVNNAPPKVDANLSARRRFEMHRANPACSPCHSLMDPLGAPFEMFDPIGRYRTTDGKLPVDSTGQVLGTMTSDGPVDDAAQLMRRLAAAPEVASCVARQWFRYAFGQQETDADAGTLGLALAAADAAGGKLPELLVGLTTTKGFRYRLGGQKP